MKTIGEVWSFNLKRLRGNRRQIDVAEASHMSLRAYQRMEKAGALPKSPGSITDVARALGVPETALFADPDMQGGSVVRQPTPAEALEIVASALRASDKPKTAELSTEDAALLDAVHRIQSDQLKRLLRPIFLAANPIKNSDKNKKTG